MDIAFHGRHDDFAIGFSCNALLAFLLFKMRKQPGDSLFHHARRLDHLRQEHLARPEQVADDIHSVHQRAFDHAERVIKFGQCGFSVGVNVIGDTMHQGVLKPFCHRP